MSLLIVEDDLLLRKQMAAQLERLGADVTGAATIAEARRLATDLNFDFVFLDVNLPDGSGLELLKGRAFSSNLGVIVMTADGGVAARSRPCGWALRITLSNRLNWVNCRW
jgi:DNA-binding response OmpR family regulator